MNELKILLEQITHQFGNEVLHQERCIGIIKDLQPNIPLPQLNTLRFFITQGICLKIFNVYSTKTPKTLSFALNNLKQSIIEANFFSEKQLQILDLIFELSEKKTIPQKTIEKINYPQVTIGNQVWMTQNLNVDKFRNGDPIPQAKTDEHWKKAGENREPAWCYYNNNPANGEKYGKLYNWYAVNDTRGLVPEGWKTPSCDEWTELKNYLNGAYHAATKMKSTSGWAGNGNGNNSSGFSGVPGGVRDGNGTFNTIGKNGFWWSSTEINSNDIWFCLLSKFNGFVIRTDSSKGSGFSVRCLRAERSENKIFSESTIEKLKYPEVTIGKQVWKTENLNVDKFRNGDPILYAKTDEEWKKAGEIREPAWCYYNNDPSNGEKFGKLYNWYAVNDPRGLAPEGWKIPSDDDWTQLTDYLGGGNAAGLKMKGTSGWAGNGNGNNSSGFSGLSGGLRSDGGTFSAIGKVGVWWSSTEDNTDGAWYRVLSYTNGDLHRTNYNKDRGFSVRCLRVERSVNKTFPESTIEKLNYPHVTIGNQVWMTENLNADKFRNGDPIPHAKTDEEWEKAGENREPAWCNYENEPANGEKYGKLYNWYAVNDPRGLAPESWIIPSDDDWTQLIDYLGGRYAADLKMKSTSGWAGNDNGNNSSGFSGLPGGFRLEGGGPFLYIGVYGVWWSSTEFDTDDAWYRSLFTKGNVIRLNYYKDRGFSVRCLKDSFYHH